MSKETPAPLPSSSPSSSLTTVDRAKTIAKAVLEIQEIKREAPGRAYEAAKEAGIDELQRQGIEMMQDATEAAMEVALGLEKFIPVLLSKMGPSDYLSLGLTIGSGMLADVQEWLSADDLRPDETMERIIEKIRSIVKKKDDPELNSAWAEIELTFQEAKSKSERGIALLDAFATGSFGEGLSVVEKKRLLEAAWAGAKNQLQSDWEAAIRQAHKIEDTL